MMLSDSESRRAAYAAAVDAIWAIDPLGMAPRIEGNADEYDQLVASVLRILHSGGSVDEALTWALDEVEGGWGLLPTPSIQDGLREFVATVWSRHEH